jgi:ubiquinone/menaquinone biosynthesis C-methylase UbiE
LNVFGECAESYDRIRPNCPTALWDDALAGMNIDIQNLTALDVCAGTGFGAKASINKGLKNVIAVDTDQKMLQQPTT